MEHFLERPFMADLSHHVPGHFDGLDGCFLLVPATPAQLLVVRRRFEEIGPASGGTAGQKTRWTAPTVR
jgi:hypothetical protein